MPAKAARLRMIGEFDPQLLEQVVDWEFDFFGDDDAGLELIGFKKGIQHAQHDVRRLVELPDQFQAFLVPNLLGQSRPHQDDGLQRLPQIVAGSRKDARLPETGAIRVPLGCNQCHLRASALGDVARSEERRVGKEC